MVVCDRMSSGGVGRGYGGGVGGLDPGPGDDMGVGEIEYGGPR